MKGIAIRYISLFVLGLVSLMVALSIFFHFFGFSKTVACRMSSISSILFGSQSMSSCDANHEMETYQIYDSDCPTIAKWLSSYMIACWRKSGMGSSSKDMWCYEVYLQNASDNCTPEALAGNLTLVLKKLDNAVNENSYIVAPMGGGAYPVYVMYNGSSQEVGII